MSSRGQQHTCMLDGTLFDSELFELYNGKISAHHAKAAYDYPIIRSTHFYTTSGSSNADLPNRAR
jgi:hypothetical protein